jgi:hypothetical protein
MATSNSKPSVAEKHNVSELPPAGDTRQSAGSSESSLVTTALVLGGLALVRPQLITGMAIGAGVSLLSGRMSKLIEALRPGLKTAVKAAYSAAEAVAMAAEEIQDLVIEARAEQRQAPSNTPDPLRARRPYKIRHQRLRAQMGQFATLFGTALLWVSRGVLPC